MKNIDPLFAYQFAKAKHEGQLDDSGKDYFLYHVCQVGELVRSVTKDSEVVAAAYLHDTIEDTDTTYEEIKKYFGNRVADLVMELTHEGNKQDGYTFPRLKSKDAILIKFADRLSNLSRMEAWDEDRQNHYLKRSKFWKEAL
jgi:(p)ppGpp synthase/HD superfamily hydrolase